MVEYIFYSQLPQNDPLVFQKQTETFLSEIIVTTIDVDNRR